MSYRHAVFNLYCYLQIKREHFVEGRHVIKYHIIRTLIQLNRTTTYLLGCMLFSFSFYGEGGIISTNNFKGNNSLIWKMQFSTRNFGKISRLITDFQKSDFFFVWKINSGSDEKTMHPLPKKVKWSVPKGTVQMYRMYLEM